MNTDAWKALLDEGVREGDYPCYAAAVGRRGEVFFRATGGDRACFPAPLPLTEDTLFDMASLSKLIGTSMVALRMIERGELGLGETVGDFFADCHGKERITVEHLMTHTAGLPSYFPMWKRGIPPEEAADTILAYPAAAGMGERVIYSCMGYILLGKMLEARRKLPLDVLAEQEVFAPLGMARSCYAPPPCRTCVSTELDPLTNEYVCGQVHDENARSLGGISGNAGIFAPLDDVMRFADMLSRRGEGYLRSESFADAARIRTTPAMGEARGLGFQIFRALPFPVGGMLSRGSFGHTGFTGTALYVDNESDVYCLLLTNRVHFGRETPGYFARRRSFFDRVFTDIRKE